MYSFYDFYWYYNSITIGEIMNGLIKLDSNLESIKTARMYFHCISITASILGILIWSISPFVMNGGKKPLVIFGRYATLFFTNLSGISLLVSANYLKKTNYIIKASEKATENIYINQIANTQLIQRKYYENLSMQLPDILASQEINNSGLLQQYQNDDIQLMPELPENLIPLFNIACENGQITLRDVKRKFKDLDSDTTLDMFDQMEKLGYGQIEKKGLSIKFIPKMD